MNTCKTKLSLEVGDYKVSSSWDRIDVSIDEIIEALRGMLVAHTYSNEAVNNSIIELGRELEELKEG